MKRLGIFMISYNRPDFLRTTYSSLLFYCPMLTYKCHIHIIDNCSTDPAVHQYLDNLFNLKFPNDGSLNIYKHPENYWVNRGHERVWPNDLTRMYDYILCCDNDVQFLAPIGDALDYMEVCNTYREKYPLCSLHDSPEHPAVNTVPEGIKLKKAERGTALLGTASFFQENRPLPIHKNLDFDWHLCRDSPRSIQAQGKLIPTFPRMTRHLGWKAKDSTWQNEDIAEYEYE